MRGNRIKHTALGFALATVGISVFGVGNLTSFQAGTPIKAGEVNQNFNVLKDAVSALETGKQNALSGGPCPAGQFVQGISADGAVSCGIDQVGATGSAGVSSLNGKTGSLALEAGSGISVDNSQAGRVILSATVGSGLSLPFSGSPNTNQNAFQINNSGGNAIYGGSSRNNGIGVSGVSGNGLGVSGYSESGVGVDGVSNTGRAGVRGVANSANGHGVEGRANGTTSAGVMGLNPLGAGVYGQTNAANNAGVAGEGTNSGGYGVWGRSEGVGVYGRSGGGTGVQGNSDRGVGVSGFSFAPGGVGVRGTVQASTTINAVGVEGLNTGGLGYGVRGEHRGNGFGVYGTSAATGVGGQSSAGYGVLGQTGSGAAVVGEADNGDVFRGLRRGSSTLTTRITSNGFAYFQGGVYVREVLLTSDRNAKSNFRMVDTGQVLEKLAALPISHWTYKSDPLAVQHIGPTAQDFKAAFGLEGDGKTISAVDGQGVALAAIQGLNRKLEREVQVLRDENKTLRDHLASLEARLARMETGR